MLWLLLAVTTLKLGLLFVYVQRHHGLGRPWFQPKSFVAQFRHCAPFGLSAALYSLRGQADQWVAAALFTLHSFAAFSIAAILGQVVNLFRNSVLEAFLPSMSRMQAAGDLKSMMEMNARANQLVATLLYPLLAFVFVYAEELVGVIYTSSYVDAAPAMRVYAFGMALLAVEVGSLLLLMRQGTYALGVNSVALVLSILVSWFGARHFGLAGAALGSVLALCLDRAITLRRIAASAGISMAALQDWRGLARAGACAAGAALLAWIATTFVLVDAIPLARLSIGGLVLSAAYGLTNLRRRAA
jgi:O-antigen/teichoic acid export membrane protein